MKRITPFCALALAAFLTVPSFGQDKTPLSLTLEDSIVRALKSNLNLAVEVYNPEIAANALTQARQTFLPSLSLSFNKQGQKNPSYSWLTSSDVTKNDFSILGASLVQKAPWGGEFTLSLQNTRYETNQSFQLVNPYYSSELRFDFTQPLLQGFGTAAARKDILVARNNVAVSEAQLKAVLAKTVYDVQEAYWNLVYAIENYKVNEQSVKLARDLLAKNKKEVEVGTLAPLEVLTAEATVAKREADILEAEAQIRKAEETLKSLIGNAADGEFRTQPIVLVDRPGFEPVSVSLDEAMAVALSRRPELLAERTTVETSRLNLKIARNQTLPKLDLNLGYWSPGLSGTRLLYLNDNPLLGVVIGKIKGSPSGAWRDATKFLYQNWQVGLSLSFPLSNIVGRAALAKARLDLDKDMAGLKAREQTVYLEVSDAVRSIDTDSKRVDAYRVARELAEKRLEAETKKLSVGLTTNYLVLQYQEELATARSQEIRALVDYNLSRARLERVLGESLDKRNISIVDSNP